MILALEAGQFALLDAMFGRRDALLTFQRRIPDPWIQPSHAIKRAWAVLGSARTLIRGWRLGEGGNI